MAALALGTLDWRLRLMPIGIPHLVSSAILSLRGKPSRFAPYLFVFSSPIGAPDQSPSYRPFNPPAGTTPVPGVSIVPTTPATPDPANDQDTDPQTAPVPGVSTVPMHSLWRRITRLLVLPASQHDAGGALLVQASR